MAPEGWAPDEDVARWEALEVESRERLAREAREAAAEPDASGADWDADGPSWWQDPQAEEPPSVTAESHATDTAVVTEPSPTPTVTPEILLADGDPTVGLMIEQAMTARGWIVRRVPDADLALAEFVRLPPHCFVFDYALPGMAGLDLLRQLTSFGAASATRLIVNSSQTQAIHVQRAKAIGADRFIDRPVASADELVDAVVGQLTEIGILSEDGLPQPSPVAPPLSQAPPRPTSAPTDGLFNEGEINESGNRTSSASPGEELHDHVESPPPPPPSTPPAVLG